MSHMVKIDGVQVTSLTALAKACQRIGVKLDGQKTARYYGGTVSVDAAIIVPDCEWQIGVIANGDGTYKMEADFYGREGKKLRSVVDKLKQFYPVEAAKEAARRKGYSVTETQMRDGSIKLTLRVAG